jgi:hypothetical protein
MKNFFRFKINGLQNIFKKSISLFVLWIFLFSNCFSLAGDDLTSKALRPPSFSDRALRRASPPVPDENALLVDACRSWNTMIKSGGKISPDIKAEWSLKQVFEGDIYLVQDDMLFGRLFWYSEDTGALYFAQKAFREEIGFANIIKFLRGLPPSTDKDRVRHIKEKEMEFIRRPKPLRPVEKPAAAALATPQAAPKTAPAIAPKPPVPAAPKPPPIIISEEDAAAKIREQILSFIPCANQGIMPPNMCRVIKEGRALTVWVDNSYPAPLINFMPLILPENKKSGPEKSIKIRNAPILPVLAPGCRAVKLSFDEITAKVNDPELKKQASINETTLLFKDSNAQKEWIAKTIAIMQKRLQSSQERIKNARQRHLIEVGGILAHIDESYNNYFALIHELHSAQKNIKRNTLEGKVPTKVVEQELGRLEKRLVFWPRLQAFFKIAGAKLLKVDKQNFDFVMQFFVWDIAESARWNTLVFLPKNTSKEILADIYYDACRLALLKRLPVLQKECQITDNPRALETLIETHRLAILLDSLEWDAAFTNLVKEKAAEIKRAQPEKNHPVYGLGVLFLDAENRPRQFIPGGGAIAPPDDLAVFYNHLNITDWHRPKDKIVLLAPTIGRFPNLEQFTAYV